MSGARPLQRWWTDDEIGFLEDHDDWSATRIAKELNRGRQAVQKKRLSLRRGEAMPTRQAWTEYEDDFLLDNPDMDEATAAGHLGRSRLAIAHRRSILGRRHGISFYGSKNPQHVGDRPLLAKTCGCCGLLLEPRWFGRRVDKNWRSSCIRCRPPQVRASRGPRSESSQVSYVQLQALTKSAATRHGEEWTDVDHETLADPDMTVLAKALRLGRTYAATATQCSKNNYKSLVGHGDPVKGQWRIDNPNAEALRPGAIREEAA